MTRTAEESTRGSRARGLPTKARGLLNVGLSRAKEQLVVIADMSRLQAAAPQGAVSYLLKRMRLDAARLDPAVLGAGESPVRRLPLDIDELLDDVRGARETVVVVSPQLSSRSPLAGLLGSRAASGICVRVVTGPARCEADTLRQAGVVVDERDPVPEALLIVDDRVVWGTSGALLDGAVSRQTALRTVSPSLALTVLGLLARRRAASEPPVLQPHATSACPVCGHPRVRVERFDGREWDTCRRPGCGTTAAPERRRPMPSQRMPPDSPSPRPANLPVFDWLVDD